MGGLTKSGIGFTQYSNPGGGGSGIPTGPANTVYWSNGVANQFTANPIVTTVTARVLNIGTTLGTPGGILENPTPSTAIAQIQRSPTLWYYGTFWDSGGLVSRVSRLGWQLSPLTNGTASIRLIRDVAGVPTDGLVGIGPERIELGTTPGGLGYIRVTHGNVVISSLNNVGAIRNLMQWGVGTNNRLTVGTGSDICVVDGAASSTDSVYVFGNGVPILILGTGRVEMRAPDILWGSAIAVPRLGQLNTAGAAQNLIVVAQGSTAGNNNGGIHRARGGRTNGTGLMGGVSLELNVDDSTVHVMAQVANVLSSNRVLSVCFGSLLTNVQMPANTGDRVMFVGDRNTAPSADAVGGHVYYSDSARPAWRFNATNLRLDGTAATATLGAGVLPATPEGFLTITLNGTVRKVPYYNN